jgi:hypothetical protein
MTLGNFTLLDEEREEQKKAEEEKYIETPPFCYLCVWGPQGVHSCRALEKYIKYEGEQPYLLNKGEEKPHCFLGFLGESEDTEEINIHQLFPEKS